ncbi:unnamed protein product, partial [Heterobilharzia americana]
MGFKFCVPAKNIRQIEVEAQFENLNDQLRSLRAASEDNESWFKSKMVDIAYQFRTMSSSQKGIISKEYWRSLRELRENKDLVILSSDKGECVTLVNKTDYVTKMLEILSDNWKFILDSNAKDQTSYIEKQMVQQLKQLLKAKYIDETTFKSIKPIGSQIAKLNGRAKIHKPGVPLRLILSMINSPYHKVAQWLCGFLELLRKRLGEHTVSDTFQFVRNLTDFNSTGGISRFMGLDFSVRKGTPMFLSLQYS